jgi:nucleoside-diphosphate-sugar epimerase
LNIATFKLWLGNRRERGFSVAKLGPNEARLLYDFLTAVAATAGVMIFFAVFRLGSSPWLLGLSPFLLLTLNAILGIYSRFRIAPGIVKAGLLTVSILGVCGLLAWALPGNRAQVVLWGLLAAPPLLLGRLLLSAVQGRHRGLTASMIKQRGPVLITGGAGYIGSGLIHLLLSRGHSVRILDSLMYGAESIKEFKGHRNFELVVGDVTDVGKLTEAMQGAAAVVHLAGLVGDPACAVDPAFTRQMNVISTQLVKDVAQATGVYRFVFASSCSVYGMSDTEVKESDRLNPVSLYAETKIDSEQELLSSTRDEFFVTVLRFATVFGHSRRPRFDLVANLFTAQAMKEGRITVIGPDQWRPFIHVDDLARAILLVLEAPPATVQGQIFNVGDKRQNLTILQLAETVKRVVERTGKEVGISVREQSAQDRRNYAASFEKIKRTFGFEAATSVEQGIQDMVEHFRRGDYADYHEEIYSNVATTKKSVTQFYDPMHTTRLYAPLNLGKTESSPPHPQ